MTRLFSSLPPSVRLAALVVVLAVALPVAWYLGSPLFINRTVDEAFPAAAPTMAAPAATGAPAPVALRVGQFGVVDAIHRAEGTATIYRLPGGGLTLRLEDFRSTNGPDLFVYLSGHPAPRSSSQVHERPGLEVARLKGNVGNQNYDLPADLDLGAVKSVVIYCKQFTTVFSTAELGAGA